MIGLLYKDFTAVKGKPFCIALFAQFVLVALFGLLNRGSSDADALILGLYMLFTAASFCYVLFFLDAALFRYEKTGKLKRYCLSTPVSKREYVTEKFVFVLITLYAILSLFYFEGTVCRALCAEDGAGTAETAEIPQVIAALQELLPVLAGTVLAVFSLEFAFVFALGFEKGNQVKAGSVIALFLIFAVYLLFGDLTLLERFNLAALVSYIGSHPVSGALLTALLPALGGLCYAVSWRFCVRCFEKKEDLLDE